MKHITKAILAAVAILATPAVTFAAVPYTGPTPVPMISTYEERFESNVKMVMHLNDNCDRACAIAHIRHALDSQKGVVGFSKEIPHDYTPTYDPAYNAFRQMTSGFYAGINLADGRHVFTETQQVQVLEDGTYRYCPTGKTLIWAIGNSFCR